MLFALNLPHCNFPHPHFVFSGFHLLLPARDHMQKVKSLGYSDLAHLPTAHLYQQPQNPSCGILAGHESQSEPALG